MNLSISVPISSSWYVIIHTLMIFSCDLLNTFMMVKTLSKLSNLIKESALKGVHDVIDDEHLFADPLSKNDAYKMYGRSNVDRWLKEKLICVLPLGSKGIIDRDKLEQVASRSNRFSYLISAERK